MSEFGNTIAKNGFNGGAGYSANQLEIRNCSAR